MARLEAADAASGNKASHLILMLKAWRRARRIDIGALALELLVTDFVSVWTYHRRSLLFYDWMVRDFFFWLRFHDINLKDFSKGLIIKFNSLPLVNYGIIFAHYLFQEALGNSINFVLWGQV